MVREEVDSRKREGLNWGLLEQDLQDFQDGGVRLNWRACLEQDLQDLQDFLGFSGWGAWWVQWLVSNQGTHQGCPYGGWRAFL